MNRGGGGFLHNASICSEGIWKQDHQWKMGMDKQMLGELRREKDAKKTSRRVTE